MASYTPGMWKGGKLLLALADFLENDPRVKGHFDMGTVVDAKMRGSKPDLSACGSAACAIGWAPHVPAIRRAGLSYGRHYDGSAELSYNGEWEFFDAAAAAVFGISYGDAEQLFTERPANRTPKQVARNLRRFVRSEAKRRAAEGC